MVGVTFFSDGVALAHIEDDDGAALQLRQATSVDCAAGGHGAELARMVQRFGLQGCACVAVMARGSYSLVQVEVPAVPEEEQVDAVRWQIKDLLDFPAEEAVIEMLPAPAASSGNMAFTVAAAQKKVRYVVDAVTEAGLDLKAIDIPELVLRNVLMCTDEQERGVALLTLWEDSGLITIVRDGELCMARRINLGVEKLVSAGENGHVDGVELTAAQQEVLDAIVLEIQRSLDYYESGVSRQPVARVYVAPLVVPVSGLLDYLAAYLAPPVANFELGRYLDDAALGDDNEQRARCLAAVGAAMRREWS